MASKNENDRKNLTELEACVLALVAKEGPCTAYSIRKQFEESLTSTWHASTGSIYPLIRRMTERGLLARQDVESDGRGAKEIEEKGNKVNGSVNIQFIDGNQQEFEEMCMQSFSSDKTIPILVH